MALVMVVLGNNACAEEYGYHDRIAYLVDRSSFGGQFADAYNLVCNFEERMGIPIHTGNMAFGSDSTNSALQAADVIAWSARRSHESNLTGDFEPLKKLFDPQVSPTAKLTRPHFGMVIAKQGIEKFARGMDRWITERGSMPETLVDTLRIAKAIG